MINIKHVGVQRFEHIQEEPLQVWNIVHNLNKPSVVTRVIINGAITLPSAVNHIDDNTVQIEFSRPRSGSIMII